MLLVPDFSQLPKLLQLAKYQEVMIIKVIFVKTVK